MIKHTVFLKWWLLITGIFVGVVMLSYINAWETLWEKDMTKLSFVVLSLFFIMSDWCGYKTWKISRILNLEDSEERSANITKLERRAETGWFASDLCLSIGMMGTVIGFIMMLGGFIQVDVSDSGTIQNLITDLGAGMSTALYSTLVGLVCSALLKIQYFNLSQAIDKAKNQ